MSRYAGFPRLIGEWETNDCMNTNTWDRITKVTRPPKIFSTFAVGVDVQKPRQRQVIRNFGSTYWNVTVAYSHHAQPPKYNTRYKK